MPPRRARPRRQRPPQNPFGNPDMGSMMKTMAGATVGVVAIGGMTTLGIGALNAIKPGP